MKAPVQCALWKNPTLCKEAGFFEVLETFGDEEHWARHLFKCRECGQLYIHEFYEEVNFSGGDDDQYVNYTPVETPEEINALKDLSMIDLIHHYPRLAKDSGGTSWIDEP